MLSLAEAFAPPDFAYFAQAAEHSWYPHSFLAPLADYQRWLSSAMQVIVDMLRDLASDGIPPPRVVLLGFSQGGCLDFRKGHAKVLARFAAVLGIVRLEACELRFVSPSAP